MNNNRKVAELLEEAEQAVDPSANGLMDRNEFPVVIGKLLVAMRSLLAENDQLRQDCNEYIGRLSNPPRQVPPRPMPLPPASLLSEVRESLRN